MNTSIKSISETNETRCYVMDLKKEYGSNKVGKENFALITDLSEAELRELFGDTLNQYEPFVIMTLEMGEAIFESYRNDWKHLKRQQNEYPFDRRKQGLFEEQNEECVKDSDSYTLLINSERTKALELALATLTDTQRNRLEKHIFDKKTITEIAKEEKKNWKSIKNSVEASYKKIRKFIEDSEYAEYFGGDN